MPTFNTLYKIGMSVSILTGLTLLIGLILHSKVLAVLTVLLLVLNLFLLLIAVLFT